MTTLSRFLLLAIFMIASSLSAVAQSANVALKAGDVLYWVGHDGSSSYRLKEVVLYHDDDLTLYQAFPDEYEADRELLADDFYILLSGVQYIGCDRDLPSDEYREKLKTFVRDGADGDQFDLVSNDPSTLEIKAEESFFLMGETYAGTWISSDLTDERNLIDRQTGLNFKLLWADDLSDTLVLKTEQKEIDFSEIMVHLGKCATLISE